MRGLPDALASFAGKWIAAEPELGIALDFLPLKQRAAQAAWACLQREIEHAALGIRDNDVAVTKLTWWYEELLRASAGEARHPLTQALAADRPLAAVPLVSWQALANAAIAQRERLPAATLDGMLAGFHGLHAAAAEVERLLFGDIDVEASAQASAISQALRGLASMTGVLDGGHLPLPLDSLARHQLTRDDLRIDSPARRLALREAAAALLEGLRTAAAARPCLGLLRRATLIADQRRARAAARSGDPSVTLAAALTRVSPIVVWRIWRAARAA